MRCVLALWLRNGTVILDGLAEKRSRGDEDILPVAEALGYQGAGDVKIIGEAKDIPTISIISKCENCGAQLEKQAYGFQCGHCGSKFYESMNTISREEEFEEWLS